ncbi:hypothetical protein GCM10027320_09770 [Massilia solisilvae]
MHVLDASKDGLQQISAILEGRSGVGGLHVVGHGAEGSLNFGSVNLDSANIGGYTEVLGKIGAALAAGGDILLYGCDVGAAAIGARFVGQIAQATGADVAASTDATGGAQRGGDWVLEYRQGDVTSDGALNAAAVHSLDTLLGLMPTGLQDVTPTMSTSSFVGGFTLSVQTGYSLTGAYDANGLYFNSPAAPNEWRDAKFTVTADNTNITGFNLDGINWIKYSATGTFSILVSGFNAGGGLIAQTTVSTANGSTTYTGGDFSGFVGIHTFTVEIIGSSDPLVHWPISQNTFDGFSVSNPIAANIAPTFVDTTTQLTDTENTAVNLAALLHVSDTDSGQTLTWSQDTAPSHGVLTFSSPTATSGSTDVTPGGSIVYTPTTGYAGTDSFVVKVSDGTATATRTVNVTVKPPAASAPVLTAATDTGLSNSDKLTKATSVSFSGAGAAGDSTSTVQVWVDKNGNGVYDAGTDLISTSATLTSGTWTSPAIDVSTLANGSYNVYGQITGGGQVGPTSSAGSFTIDRTAPTVTISSNVSKVLVGQTATITFTFSEDPGSSFTWNGTSGDVVVTGGTLGAISGSGTTRTATFTPTAGLDSTSASITIAAGSYTDAAGNNGGAGTTPSLTIDTLAPTVTITSDKSALKIGETASITFTFSEDPGAAFDASDIAVTGGTLGALSGTGTTRSATFTPTSGTNGGTASITVAAGAYADAAGNASGAGATPSLTFDTLAPTLAISSNKAALKAGETATITFTFSEDPGATFDAGDVTVTGGTLGTVSGTGTTRTATFTPTANTNAGTASITVAGGTYTDGAGNDGGAGATPSVTFDTLAPTVTVTSDKSALKIGETATITFTFSEDPGAAFDASDITVSGGTLGALSGTGTTRSATFTPTASTNGGTASITVAAGAYADAAGNASGAGATPSLSFDTLAPTLTITSDKAALKIGETATITFTFSEDPGATFDASDLTVTGGTLGALSGTGTTRTATFTPTASTNGGTASITVAGGTYTDSAGNNGAAGATPSVSFDTLAPTLAISSDKAALKAGETATITFTFSEDPGASFDASDVLVTGGTLGAVSGTGTTRTATFTPTANINAGTASITVAGGTYTDGAGNNGGAGATPSLTFDTLAPTVTVTSDKAALKIGETATITFTFSEDPGAAFDASDLTVTGGTLGALSGTGTTRTAVFTPTNGVNAGTASITVAAGAYADAAGNASGAGATPSLTFDTLAPTLTITSDKSALKAGDTATITFTFSEDPGATFDASDLTVTGGTLGALSGTGTTRTATFTPTANTNAGTASITVAGGTYTDGAGNNGGAGATPGVTFDTLAPTLAITSDKAALKAGDTATITFTFSEDPGATFDASDILVTGGTLGTVSGTGTTRTATFTPTANINAGTASITVAGGTYTDGAGNNGGAGATPSLTFDTLAPTVTVTSDKAALKIGETATITFTFSEDPGAAFDASDIAVTGGTLGALSGTGTTRSATFTPTASTNGGTASITVAAGAYADAAGNASSAGATPSLTFDTLAPTLAITSDKSALKAGETATITFTFSEDPGATFGAGDVTVTGGTLGTVSGTGTTRTATFTPTANTNAGTASITVAGGTYTDAAGNNGGAGATPSVSFDTLAPTLAITSDKSALKIGETATITFTFSEDPGATFDASDVLVSGGTLGTLSGTGTTRTAIFTPANGVNAGSASITVAGGTYADGAGNNGGAGATPGVTFDTLAPTVTITSDKAALKVGETATITFTFSEDPGATFDASDLAVTGGTLGALSGTGTTRTATFTPTASTNGGTASITVAGGTYTDAAGNTGAAGATPGLTFDTLAPTLAITSDKAALKAGEAATITFTFSEDPGASFDASDVLVTGGTLGTVSGTGTTRTATFTPTANTNAGTASITVAGGTYTDGAGNNGGAGATPGVTFDTLAPTVTITSDKAALKIGQTATVTFTFSEDPGATFDASDVLVTGGTLGALSGTGTTRTAVFTPANGVNAGTASITVAGGAYTDGAGNNGGAGATPSVTFDTLAPTVTITSDKAALKVGETATITFTFSEDPGATFDASDLAVTGGTLGALTGTGTTRTATFTPTANTNGGTASITVAAGSYTDGAGNNGGAGATPGVTFDTLAPNAPSAPALAAGSDTGTSATDNQTNTTTPTLTGTAEAGATVKLYDGASLIGTGTATAGVWSITAPALSEGTHSITAVATDAAGNTGPASAPLAVTIDTTVPTLAITADKPALKVGETAIITFTFSEDPGTTFDASDVLVSGGTLGTWSGTGTTRTAVFTPTNGVNAGTASITVAGGTYTDTAGNNGGAGATPSLSFDTLAPTVTITSDKAALKAGETATITFTFSEDPGATFDASDLAVSGGTLGALSGMGTTRTATFTPTASTNGGTASITVAGGTYADGAGNTGGAGATPGLTFDTLAPTLAITSDKAALKIGETAAITFTFSEDPGATFDASDVLVSGGTLGTLSGTGTTRTATFTPTANTNAGTASITVAGGAYTDGAGNNGGAGVTPGVSFDTLAPTVAITSDKAALKIGETATITFTFSEDPGATFDAGDVAVSGGTLGALSGTGTTRTATFTPDANMNNKTASITVAAGAYADAAGNAGGAGATPALTFDTLAPSAPSVPVLDAASDSGVSNSDGLTNAATLRFTGTAEDGATVKLIDPATNAVLGTGVAAGGTWAIDVSGLAEGIANIAAVATDTGGNTGPASAASSVTIDRAAPAAPSIALTSGGSPGSVVSYGKITVSGIEAGASWQYSVDGGAHWQNGSGTEFIVTTEGSATVLAHQTDGAGNTSVASNPLSFTLDTSGPTSSVSLNDLALTSGETATVTISFNERVVGFDLNDISASNATLSNLSSSDGGRTWTALMTPNPGVSSASNVINVNNTGVTDGVGNRGIGSSTSPNYTVQTGRLAAAIDLSDTSLLAGETAVVTIRFGEAVTGFTLADLVAENGKLSNLASTDNGSTWTALFTPTTNIDDTSNLIKVDNSGVIGAQGQRGEGQSTSANYTVNTIRPTASITVDTKVLAPGANTQVTIKFSQPVLGFDSADLTVSHATLSALASNDGGTTWTATLTADTGGKAASPGSLAIDLGGVRTAIGNAGIGSVSAHYVVAPAGSAIGTVDGVQVVSQSTTDPNTGRVQQVLLIPEVPAGRVDDPNTPNQKLADIPLVSNPAPGGAPALTASLPVGTGLQVEGPAAPLSTSDALTDLIHRIQDKTTSGSASQTDMTSQGQGFLNSLGANGQVESRTIVPTVSSGTAPSQPIVISGAGTGNGPNAPVVGLVIDGAGLPAGSTLQLDNVDFAAVIGDVRLIGGLGKNYVVGDGASQTIYLGPDDDVLSGGGGDDFIGSAGGDDHLDGGDGNDLVAGGIGNDTVIGGAGDDMLNGGRSTVGDWTFHMTAAGAISATHDKAVFTAAGTEVVQGAELDATVSELGFLKAAPEQLAGIAMLYAGLDRAPDVAGLTFWARAGVSLADVANGVLASAEFGGSALAHADNATFVRGMYLQVLGREPESAAMEYWSARLSGSDGRAPSGRADVLVAVALSDEHKGKMLAADGYTIAQGSLAQETAWFSGSGDDRLEGGTGHNLLVGGDGVDTAVYGGNQAQYHVLIGTDGLLRVADTGSDSLDTLSGIEVAEFKDGKVDLTALGKDVGQLDRVGLMFQTVFHHAAGLDALKSFLALNTDAPGMARALVATSEFQSRFGGTSDAAFVQALYANSGLDASKAGGMQSWQDYLGHHSRAELIATWIAQDDVQHAQFGNAGLWLF